MIVPGNYNSAIIHIHSYLSVRCRQISHGDEWNWFGIQFVRTIPPIWEIFWAFDASNFFHTKLHKARFHPILSWNFCFKHMSPSWTHSPRIRWINLSDASMQAQNPLCAYGTTIISLYAGACEDNWANELCLIQRCLDHLQKLLHIFTLYCVNRISTLFLHKPTKVVEAISYFEFILSK